MEFSFNIKLNIALSETTNMDISLANQKYIHYIIKHTFNKDIRIISVRIKNKLQYGCYTEILKTLILYHILSREGSSNIFTQIADLNTRPIKKIKDITDFDTSKYSYWVFHYLLPLQKSLLFHRKYPFFTGKFSLPNGITLPSLQQNTYSISVILENLVNIFHSYKSVILDFFSKKTSNMILHQMVLLCIKDIFAIYSLIIELANYHALLSHIPFEPSSYQMSGMKSSLDLITSCSSQNHRLASLIHLNAIDPIPINPITNKSFVKRYNLENIISNDQPIAEPPLDTSNDTVGCLILE
ncbi:hypothetical protein EHI8A_044400 [Entamoeba histolytica HM-1:IMSS-B]|uniref:AP180 N-terminal homology (ANTH) domain-containing protein n=6 Tax=Entamoeba histolytica TaxID=5759 RepID=C4M6I2_ENTH1|nr:hypothetical protein EHI_173450 [Entamoeba histolytica HM-1:IMSS]EMD44240.1 Hypothetical protein EHI5A_075270 [Entamoeba histolytica KU27]EMH75758.1 hypothetical protein EHI8A_044400 [Entamoeba histolytica HM-1:IMSS-B]EMS16398.1 hypothetical protein KM1_089110 [Entamoeba histolytica HM-3:IMSS]ENY64568.1 hypothetical protein EHI7A_044960 [Entamoeba histolytica HM-1:IMSS-A]GAT97098.1 hypothetical protein CL6EHI_173450 [Entamoeba histolytica]|eukprot:XP_649136.1 hypothetical protein EHI_173450 [Entamoeba histolytica HM-1:IMSS]